MGNLLKISDLTSTNISELKCLQFEYECLVYVVDFGKDGKYNLLHLGGFETQSGRVMHSVELIILGLIYLLYKALQNILHLYTVKKVYGSQHIHPNDHPPLALYRKHKITEQTNRGSTPERTICAKFYCNLGRRGTTAGKSFTSERFVFFCIAEKSNLHDEVFHIFQSGEAAARLFPFSRSGVGGVGTSWC